MFSQRFKQLREAHGYTQKDISKILKVGQSAISMFENGERMPSRENMEFLADIFNVNLDYLYGRSDEKTTKIGPMYIPLLGTIAAGKPILAEEHIEDLFLIDERINADFVIKVKGDSMIGAGIFDGEYCFIKQQDVLENGEMGAILIDGEATLKRFFRNNGTVILVAENPKYKPMTYTDGNLRIMGKLVARLRLFE